MLFKKKIVKEKKKPFEMVKGKTYLVAGCSQYAKWSINDIVEVKVLNVTENCYKIQHHQTNNWVRKIDWHRDKIVIDELCEELCEEINSDYKEIDPLGEENWDE